MNERDFERREKARQDAIFDAQFADEPTSDVEYADEPQVNGWPLYSGLPKPMKPTQEQVIAWAREAGATRDHPEHLPDIWTMDTEGFLQFAAIAYEAGRKDENEACAKYLESKDDGVWANTCAAAIRAKIKQ